MAEIHRGSEDPPPLPHASAQEVETHLLAPAQAGRKRDAALCALKPITSPRRKVETGSQVGLMS